MFIDQQQGCFDTVSLIPIPCLHQTMFSLLYHHLGQRNVSPALFESYITLVQDLLAMIRRNKKQNVCCCPVDFARNQVYGQISRVS